MNKFFILLLLLIYNFNFVYAQSPVKSDDQNNKCTVCKIILEISIPTEKIQEWKLKKNLIHISELRQLVLNNFNSWISMGNYLGITCQAVTPLGKFIGSFDNPDYTTSVPGGQSKTCNLWLIKKDQKKISTKTSSSTKMQASNTPIPPASNLKQAKKPFLGYEVL